MEVLASLKRDSDHNERGVKLIQERLTHTENKYKAESSLLVKTFETRIRGLEEQNLEKSKKIEDQQRELKEVADYQVYRKFYINLIVLSRHKEEIC